MNLNFKSKHSIPQTTQSTSFLTCIWLIQGLIDEACEVKFLTMWGNPRQSWIVDSTQWIPDSRYSIPVFVSRTWILDTNFLVGFRIPYAVFRIPKSSILDSVSKIFLDSGVHKHRYMGEKSHLENLRKVWCFFMFWFNFILRLIHFPLFQTRTLSYATTPTNRKI